MTTMIWSNLLSEKRLNGESLRHNDLRSPFEKDIDRIVFSSQFRRLGKKTQVHPLAKNDHIHSRLTHSLEVASVGRSLGYGCGMFLKRKKLLPKDLSPFHIGQIIQAACLAHDIGNPPFGHAGEEAIKQWFNDPENSSFLGGLNEQQTDDLQNFEGNAQGFRILTNLEYANQNGMELTFATLGAMLKYPWTSMKIKESKKFCCFESENKVLERVAKELHLLPNGKMAYFRHPLAFLMEAADDICYRVLDLEDAFEMKILRFDDICDVLKPVCLVDRNFDRIIDSNISNGKKISYLRAITIGEAVKSVNEAFESNYTKIISGQFAANELINYCSTKVMNALNQCKALTQKVVFGDQRKIELEIGCYATMKVLLSALCGAVREASLSKNNYSFKTKRVLSLLKLPEGKKDLYENLLLVTDFISGMTDNYASYMAQQIGGMGQ